MRMSRMNHDANLAVKRFFDMAAWLNTLSAVRVARRAITMATSVQKRKIDFKWYSCLRLMRSGNRRPCSSSAICVIVKIDQRYQRFNLSNLACCDSSALNWLRSETKRLSWKYSKKWFNLHELENERHTAHLGNLSPKIDYTIHILRAKQIAARFRTT